MRADGNGRSVAPVELGYRRQRTATGDPAPGARSAHGGTKTAIDFKWADNLQQPGEVMDFYLSGDVAPEGRFNYRYSAD